MSDIPYHPSDRERLAEAQTQLDTAIATIRSLRGERDRWKAIAESTERDARLGAKVREAVMAGSHTELATMADDVDAATSWTTPGEVLRTIADALREEASR
jgi:hypothetical protein